MPNAVDWSQWGIAGALVGFLVYLCIWSLMKNSPQALAQSREDLRNARSEFMSALKEQRTEFTAALKEQRTEFFSALQELTKESEDAITRAVERAVNKVGNNR